MVTKELTERYNELLKVRKSMRKKSDKKTKRVYRICFIIGLFIGLIASFATGLFIGSSYALQGKKVASTAGFNPLILYLFGIILVLFFSLILQIILHEAGHLIFGLLTGYRFLSFRIFSFVLYKKDGHLYKKKFSIKGTGGQCLMYPPIRREDGSFPFVWYNLGGGINNLIFSLPFIIPAILIHNTFARVIFILFIFIGLLLAATNLIPIVAGLPNDGMNLKSMLKDKSMQDAFYLQLRLNAEMSDGKLITEYSPEEFVLAEGADDTNMLIAFLRLYSYYQKLAFHDYEAAERILADMEAKFSKYAPMLSNTVEVERLFFMVLKHSPIEEIAAIYEHSRLIMAVSKTNIGIQRIRYIYEAFMSEEEKKDIVTLVAKKPPKKWKECDRDKLYSDFLKTADNFPVIGEAAMFVEIVNYIRNNNLPESLPS